MWAKIPENTQPSLTSLSASWSEHFYAEFCCEKAIIIYYLSGDTNYFFSQKAVFSFLNYVVEFSLFLSINIRAITADLRNAGLLQ